MYKFFVFAFDMQRALSFVSFVVTWLRDVRRCDCLTEN